MKMTAIIVRSRARRPRKQFDEAAGGTGRLGRDDVRRSLLSNGFDDARARRRAETRGSWVVKEDPVEVLYKGLVGLRGVAQTGRRADVISAVDEMIDDVENRMAED